LERKKSEPIVHHIPSAGGGPSLSSSSQATTPNDSFQDLTSTSATNRSERLTRKRSRSRSTQADFRVQLTFEQKLDIALSEYELTKTEKIHCEAANEKKIDQFEVCFQFILDEIYQIVLV
jgi:hypothetical protein